MTLIMFILILLGLGIMLMSVVRAYRVAELLPHSKYISQWYTLLALIVFFVFGYIGALILIWYDLNEILLSLVGLIFFAGAVFVYFVVRLEYITINDLQKMNDMQKAIAHHKEREQLTKVIERSKRLLLTVIDTTPDWIFAKDEKLRFVVVNKSFAQAMGLTPQQMIGKTIAQLGLTHLELFRSATDDTTVLQGQALHFPERHIILGAKKLYIHDTFKLPLRDKTGHVFAVLEFSRDITERIKLEAKIATHQLNLLEERQATILKLQAVDQAKSQFITMMSHELRTPLNAINGFAELLLNGLSGQISDDALKDVQVIYKSGQHLTRLINDILDITKLKGDALEIQSEAIEIKPFIDDVVTSTGPLFLEKPIALKTEIATCLPAVWADPTRLKQILFNLLSNATKFTETGTVWIKVEKAEPNHLKFTVKDTGIGIPIEKQQAIFDLFEQADMSDGRQYAGLGAGLSICQALVHMHGGEIGVQSETDIGSEFYFTIPIAKQEKTEHIP